MPFALKLKFDCLFVSAVQFVAGTLGVIEVEVFFDDVPSLRNVAEAAVLGKGFVGNHGTPLPAPAVARNEAVAIRGDDHRCDEKDRRDDTSAVSAESVACRRRCLTGRAAQGALLSVL